MAVNVHDALKTRHEGLLSIILPRHPKRGEEISAVIDKGGFSRAIRSKCQPITPDTAFYVADTLGEPGLFYRLCPVVFLGNSMVSIPGGGHNPVEPAQLGCAIVYGPNMWNFAEIEKDLRIAGGAVMVRDEKNLQKDLDALLKDTAKRTAQADAARAFVETQNGVLQNALGLLRPVLERAKIGA